MIPNWAWGGRSLVNLNPTLEVSAGLGEPSAGQPGALEALESIT